MAKEDLVFVLICAMIIELEPVLKIQDITIGLESVELRWRNMKKTSFFLLSAAVIATLCRTASPADNPQPVLYNLEEDIAEQNNVFKGNAAIVSELRDKAIAFQEDMRRNMRPAGQVR